MHPEISQCGKMKQTNIVTVVSKVGSVQGQPATPDESGIIAIILWLKEQPSFSSFFSVFVVLQKSHKIWSLNKCLGVPYHIAKYMQICLMVDP